MDIDTRNCIADLCAALEPALKLLEEVAPVALALKSMFTVQSPALINQFLTLADSNRHLGGVQAVQDGLNLLAQAKERLEPVQ